MNEQHFEQFIKSHGKTDKTIVCYLYDIRRFIETHPGYEHYTFKDISAYFSGLTDQYRREDGRVTGSVSRILSSLKWLYAYLIASGIRDEYPFPQSYRILGTRKRGINTQHLFTTGDLEHLLTYAREEPLRYPTLRYRNLVTLGFLVYQALTSDELLSLPLDAVDLENGTVTIKGTKSTNGRILSLHASQYMILHHYLAESRPRLLKLSPEDARMYPLLIISARGMQETASGLACFLRRYRPLFPGKHITAEHIRMSVIWQWLNVYKKPLHDVQVWAGHKWPSSTEQYVSAIDMEDPEAINGWHPMELL